MPPIDVTELLNDPDFATTFDVIRSAENLIAGKNIPIVSTISGVVGVVEPAASSDLQRLPDLSRLSGAITIYTTFRLTDDTPGFDADQVIWPAGGTQSYTVDLTDDWSQFGVGFIKATCRRTSLP